MATIDIFMMGLMETLIPLAALAGLCWAVYLLVDVFRGDRCECKAAK